MFRKFAILCYIIMEKQDFFRKGADFMTAKKQKKAAPFAELTLLNRNHTEYPDSPDKAKIETFVNANAHRNYLIEFDCPEFTSLCPVTGQPDFGHIRIRYVANQRCIESKALKLYLFSYRNFNTFHEAAVNRILTDLVKACAPRWMEVRGDFMPRGGIAIHVRAEEGDPSLAPKE